MRAPLSQYELGCLPPEARDEILRLRTELRNELRHDRPHLEVCYKEMRESFVQAEVGRKAYRSEALWYKFWFWGFVIALIVQHVIQQLWK